MRVINNEIVFKGHPDKMADQISDTIIMEYLKQDKKSIVNVEVVGSKKIIFITGKIYSSQHINIESIVEEFLKEMGCCDNIQIIDKVEKLSLKDFNVTQYDENITVYGYACNETEELLPKGLLILQTIAKEYKQLCENNDKFLFDGKVQMEGLYDENGHLIKIISIIINHQNTGENPERIYNIMYDLIYNITDTYEVSLDDLKLNPYGPYVLGGFDRDTGLTGRKLAIDSYQGFAPTNRTILSGTDPNSCKRCGFYKAREIAKQTLVDYRLKWCEVQINYTEGKPTDIIINSERGLLTVPKEMYIECEANNIVNDLDLLNADFVNLSTFGHIQ